MADRLAAASTEFVLGLMSAHIWVQQQSTLSERTLELLVSAHSQIMLSEATNVGVIRARTCARVGAAVDLFFLQMSTQSMGSRPFNGQSLTHPPGWRPVARHEMTLLLEYEGPILPSEHVGTI